MTKVRRERLWLLVGGGILALAIVAAITDKASPSSTPSPTSISNPTTKSQSIRRGSPLTVSGWGKGDSLEYFLFYQDHDNQVRRSHYGSVRGNTSWQDPYESSLGIAKPDVPKPQIKLFYTSDLRRLLGVSVNEQLTPWYEEGRHQAHGPRHRRKQQHRRVLAVNDLPGVRRRDLGGAQPSTEQLLSRGGVRREEGRYHDRQRQPTGPGAVFGQYTHVATLIPDLGSDELAEGYATFVANGSPPICRAARGRAPLPRFPLQEASYSLQRVDIYVLYVEGSSNVNLVYPDDSSWKTAQPNVLKKVDS
ncbi:hypothetical protein CTA2_6396 [Colletotrichum tanaceti]|uniref:Uncharacterized protein n=1 Tax=Colletotrichum tanaceti TaxID=1306861 RepID=A0A4V6DI39_9PEZI|nr:hypothetical protein CTA2_6396 [Colletotrichum tanaceti]TKW58956.1 hypothetical protein CTA1_1670 [Colletotrichum tanaceti]